MHPIAYLLTLLALGVLFGLGNTMGYHRMLTHRSFKASVPVRWGLTLLGAAFSGSPVFWVGLHRLHHTKSDGEGDPHSPIHGFWWSHCGWLLGTHNAILSALYAASGFGQQLTIVWHDIKRVTGRNPPVWRELCHDLMKEPLMQALDTPFVMPVYFLWQLAFAWLLAGWWGIAGLWFLHLWLTNTSWAVNSVCHDERFGEAPWDTRELSRDVWWMAYLTNGEGYHNSHHRWPRSARHALDGGSDLTWRVTQLLSAVGLVWDVWLPKKYR